ncbi:MAG: prolipoprotein diacylglyceryl transferase [Candidatus Dormibacteria bacterium]
MRSVIDIPFAPVFHVAGLTLHLYGAAYVGAVVVGILMVRNYATKVGYTPALAANLVAWLILPGLIGGRLYFVLQQPNLAFYTHHPAQIFNFAQGGMAVYGTILADLFVTVAWCYAKRLPVWLAMDGLCLFGTLPHAVGRIGNIINGDILGAPSHLPWATAYTNPATRAPAVGVPYQPAGAYELLASLVIWLIVLAILRRPHRPGTAMIAWIVAYPTSQFLLFFLRATEPVTALGLKQAQLTSLAVLLVVVPPVVLLRRRWPSAWSDELPPGPVRLPIIWPQLRPGKQIAAFPGAGEA